MSTLRLYDEIVVDENGEETKSFNGQKFLPRNAHVHDRLFVYYLDREDDPKIVSPKLVRTLELYRWHKLPFMRFRVCGNFLAVFSKPTLYSVEFYDMEKSRKGESDLVYRLDRLFDLGWCIDTIPRTPHCEGLKKNAFYFFSENNFVCSRKVDDFNVIVEVHEISSRGGSLVRKIELHGDKFNPSSVNLFIESLGQSTWNFYISSARSPETYIISYDKKKSELHIF